MEEMANNFIHEIREDIHHPVHLLFRVNRLIHDQKCGDPIRILDHLHCHAESVKPGMALHIQPCPSYGTDVI